MGAGFLYISTVFWMFFTKKSLSFVGNVDRTENTLHIYWKIVGFSMINYESESVK